MHPPVLHSTVYAQTLNYTEIALDRFWNRTGTFPREKTRQVLVRQNTGGGGAFPFASAHNSDALHNGENDSTRPSHMIYVPATMVVGTRCSCDKLDHIQDNLTTIFSGLVPCSRSIRLLTAAIMQCGMGNSQPAYISQKYLIAARYPRYGRLPVVVPGVIPPVSSSACASLALPPAIICIVSSVRVSCPTTPAAARTIAIFPASPPPCWTIPEAN